MEQSLYWKELFQLRFHGEYVAQYLQNAEKWDRGLSIFLAICSSASIGGWVIWKELSWVWATAIAASQVVQAIRPLLPFQERIKLLSELKNSLSELFIYADTKWPSIADGSMTNSDISSLRSEIRNRKLAFERKALPVAGLPDHGQYLETANVNAANYFKSFYGV